MQDSSSQKKLVELVPLRVVVPFLLISMVVPFWISMVYVFWRLVVPVHWKLLLPVLLKIGMLMNTEVLHRIWCL